MPNEKFFHPIRYEYGLWPLWRLDYNLAYLCKSISHRSACISPAQANHWRQMAAYVQRWQKPASQTENQFKLSAVGDVMWIRSGWESAFSAGIQTAFSTSDMIVANMETPIDVSKPVKKWIYDTLIYNAPESYLNPWLQCNESAKIVLSLCNNHALDQGVDGLIATRKTILANNPRFACLGGIKAEEAMTVQDCKGIKVGHFASTFTINSFSKAKIEAPAGVPIYPFGHPHQEPNWQRIAQQISALRQQGAELIVFSPHWGFEYEYWPDPLQRQHAYRLIEMGVDIILGHSPHVLQPLELVSINQYDPNCPVQIKRSGPPGMGIIAYSLGNFLSVMPTVGCRTAGILHLNFRKALGQFQLEALQWDPSYSLRGHGRHWLDTRVQLISELAKSEQNLAQKAAKHGQERIPNQQELV